jgi:uncharacterized damage-inducible protein DinB
MLPEFDYEAQKTRKLLERVPLDQADWRPHDKSMKLGRLATHIAETPAWTSRVLAHDSFDLQARSSAQAESQEKLLAIFDGNVSEARAAIAQTTDEQWQKQWAFFFGGHKVFERTRYRVVREMMIDHLIHHRGQLSVYLRLRDIPVPGMYGPSADEK